MRHVRQDGILPGGDRAVPHVLDQPGGPAVEPPALNQGDRAAADLAESVQEAVHPPYLTVHLLVWYLHTGPAQGGASESEGGVIVDVSRRPRPTPVHDVELLCQQALELGDTVVVVGQIRHRLLTDTVGLTVEGVHRPFAEKRQLNELGHGAVAHEVLLVVEEFHALLPTYHHRRFGQEGHGDGLVGGRRKSRLPPQTG